MTSKRIPDPQLRSAVEDLGAWTKDGNHRLDQDHDGHYEHSEAIRIMDAWWTGLLHAEFEPTLGKGLFDQIADISILDDSPSIHQGSAYNGGWYVYANKDLRQLLAKRKLDRKRKRLIRQGKAKRARKLHLKGIKGPNSRIYCGHGKIGRCRAALLASLQASLGKNPYPAHGPNCPLGDDQMCNDAIRFRPTGGVTQPDMVWMNRPTFQQALEIQGHR